MKRALLLIGVLVALGAALASPATAANSAPTATERLQTLDRQLLEAVNETRAAHGLRPLAMSGGLQDAAVAHSRAMLEQGFFAHDSANGASFVQRVRAFYPSAGFDSWTVGENLIYNTEEITAAIAIAAWMASPGHRENILTPEWREVGIGSLHASQAGGLFAGEPTWVITMDFGARAGKVTATQKAKAPAAKAKSGSKPKRTKGSKSSAKKKSATSKGKSVAAKTKRSQPSKPKSKPKSKPVDRVLPSPAPTPDDDEGDDDALADDDSAGAHEDDEGEDGGESSDDGESGGEDEDDGENDDPDDGEADDPGDSLEL